jgi:hypothetical protein
MLEAANRAPAKRKLIGLGEFESHIPDLATNEKYLEGFGH